MSLKLVKNDSDHLDGGVIEALESFYNHYSPTSKDHNHIKLRLLLRFLGVEHSSKSEQSAALIGFNYQRALRFIDWYKKRPGVRGRFDPTNTTMSVGTIKAIICVLRRSYDHLIDVGCYKKSNPFPKHLDKLYRASAAQKRPTLALSKEQVKKLLSYRFEENRGGVRNTAIIHLLFSTGLRITEVCNLKLHNVVELPEGLAIRRVHTKGGYAVSKVLPDWATGAVLRLIAQRRSEGAQSDDFLLTMYLRQGPKQVGGVDVSCHTRNVQRWIKRWLTNCGIDANLYSCHSARATAITRLLEQNVPHKEVQDFSGHKSIQMVELYDKRRIEFVEVGKKIEY